MSSNSTAKAASFPETAFEIGFYESDRIFQIGNVLDRAGKSDKNLSQSLHGALTVEDHQKSVRHRRGEHAAAHGDEVPDRNLKRHCPYQTAGRVVLERHIHDLIDKGIDSAAPLGMSCILQIVKNRDRCGRITVGSRNRLT